MVETEVVGLVRVGVDWVVVVRVVGEMAKVVEGLEMVVVG